MKSILVSVSRRLHDFPTVRSGPILFVGAMALGLRAVGGESIQNQPAEIDLPSGGPDEALSAAITSAIYGMKTGGDGETQATAANPAPRMRGTFTPEGLRLQIRIGDPPADHVHKITWRLESVGCGTKPIAVPGGHLHVDGQRAEIVRAIGSGVRLVEWFENRPSGLEHGFTLDERPGAPAAGEPLRLVLSVSGDLFPEADATGRNISLHDASGRAVASYAGLKVWDADGVQLPATMWAESGARVAAGTSTLTLTVDDTCARYPLTIDPTFVQRAYVKASNVGPMTVLVTRSRLRTTRL